MALTSFTIADRRFITDLLKLAPDQLEENARLYLELESIEQRDLRIPGLNRVGQIKRLLAEIQDLQDSIAQLEEAAGSGSAVGLSNPYGLKSVSIEGEYRLDFASADGKVGAIGMKMAKLASAIEQLGILLGMPWQDEAKIVVPVLWV